MKLRCEKCKNQIIYGKDTGDAYACRGCGVIYHTKSKLEKTVEKLVDNEHIFWYGLLLLATGTFTLFIDAYIGYLIIFLGSWTAILSSVLEHFGIK